MVFTRSEVSEPSLQQIKAKLEGGVRLSVAEAGWLVGEVERLRRASERTERAVAAAFQRRGKVVHR